MGYFKNKFAQIFFKVYNSSTFKNLVESQKQHERQLFFDKFKKLGTNVSFEDIHLIRNPQYISIGDNFASLYNFRLEAWDGYAHEHFNPQILIGNHVYVNTDVHIGCINKVSIGNNVLIGSKVFIADHSHGEINKNALQTPTYLRPLISKGPVIIENNVWIGEGVCVLPGVTIGENSIIGANAVVTKSVPPNSVAAGNPAFVIRDLN